MLYKCGMCPMLFETEKECKEHEERHYSNDEFSIESVRYGTCGVLAAADMPYSINVRNIRTGAEYVYILDDLSEVYL